MDEADFTEDVKRYGDMLHRLAFGCTGEPAVCDDIVQEAFLRYLRCRKSFDGEEGKKAWLIRVTINLCRDHTGSFRRRHQTRLCGNESAQTPDADELADLSQALKKLRPIYREVIYLHYYEGYTAEMIGKMLKISTPAVTSRLMRGREMLKKYLEEE